MSNIKTRIHTYHFDTSKPEEAVAYKALAEQLKARGSQCFNTWGGEGHYSFAKPYNGQEIELETKHLFNNQWNTAPIGDSKNGLRVFDWAEDYPIDFRKCIKRGHYLELTDDMVEIRANTHVCGYCGHQEPVAEGRAFCPACIDSPYLKSDQLHLTRLVPVCDTDKPRAALTDAERAELLPKYRDAQINGATARGKARIEKAKADIERDYEKAVAKATEKRDAARWLIANCPGVLENWIFYDHTKRHCFGWRNPVDAATLSDLLDKISEFPFAYEIKCADGRNLQGD